MDNFHLRMADQDGEIHLTHQDLLRYTGPANVIAAALMIRVCHHAFSLLSPGQPVQRRELFWTLGFPGPGILDCVEIVSHGVRDGRCLQKPEVNHPDAPMSLGGQFVFDISYQDKTLRLWPDKTFFDDEFRTQVATWQEEAPSSRRQSYLEYKASKVNQIMAAPVEALFHTQWL